MTQHQLETGVVHTFQGSDPDDIEAFVDIIRGFYTRMRRPMPWRDEITQYRVVVSEIMLQQTQVSRVMEKFPLFISRFPNFISLADASLTDVLVTWQGLGYNRRAKYLHGFARSVVNDWNGALPADPEILVTFPGIGSATAGSITAFAFNKPVVFIETNIRRVFIHHFFAGKEKIADSEIRPLVEKTLDHGNPREWYYALMDYGTWLAGRIENPNRKSSHYSRQSAFNGSDRQIRSSLLKKLLATKSSPLEEIIQNSEEDTQRMRRIIAGMVKEGLLCINNGIITVAE
ncbi:MAG TPA: A/G-specific adenine glycosylase [Methanospirillum sp.]|uniref:A/G-specific adenine glycosylase n=1 Tax=Methanospirillum sp. TaxID=45200 RepID=UPI002D0A838F|nr:A/G-specific adenine glycosylase [Methanospirillum sp.]HWQ64445.1 A/G-specific adenine glycosylase [Methanospirillum sp.]